MIHRSIYILLLFSLPIGAMDKDNVNSKVITNPKNTDLQTILPPSVVIQFPESTTPKIVNYGTTVQHHTNNYVTAASTSTAHAENTNTNINTMKSIMSSIQKNSAPIPQQLQGLLTTHKWHLTGATLVSIYALLAGLLIQGNAQMNNELKWGCWKHHLSVEELSTYCLDDHKRQELTHNLIDTILTRYFKAQQPTNHIEPLIDFSNSLEYEMKIINRYIMVASLVQKFRLLKLFPTNDTKIARALEYRRRLQCIKQLFINSMAAHNFHQLLVSSKGTVPVSGVPQYNI